LSFRYLNRVVLLAELEPGWLRAVMFNVMLIAGISTVLFNANPLLRFDGYYMLADLIEIPNLRARGAQYLQSVFERRLFGLKVPAPESGARERAWLVFFTIASFIYRLFITFAIALFIAGQYFIIGVALAIFAVVMAIVLPLVKAVAYLALHPRLRRHRLRAAAISGVMAGALVILVFGVPVPAWTNAEGVIWVPEQSVVRAGANGFVARVVAQSGSEVHQGDALIETVDPMLPLNIRALEAQKQELQTRYQAERIESLVRAQITLEQLKSLDADLDRARRGHGADRAQPSGRRVRGAGATGSARPFRSRVSRSVTYSLARPRRRVLVPQESVDMVRKNTEGGAALRSA
jgi:putative peptide zinc metalloprotease protein